MLNDPLELCNEDNYIVTSPQDFQEEISAEIEMCEITPPPIFVKEILQSKNAETNNIIPLQNFIEEIPQNIEQEISQVEMHDITFPQIPQPQIIEKSNTTTNPAVALTQL